MGLGPTPFDGVPAIVQPVFVHDSEIELRLGIAAVDGLKQVFFVLDIQVALSAFVDRATPSPSLRRGRCPFQVSALLEA